MLLTPSFSRDQQRLAGCFSRPLWYSSELFVLLVAFLHKSEPFSAWLYTRLSKCTFECLWKHCQLGANDWRPAQGPVCWEQQSQNNTVFSFMCLRVVDYSPCFAAGPSSVALADCGGNALEILALLSAWNLIRQCVATLQFLRILAVICNSCKDLKTCPAPSEHYWEQSQPETLWDLSQENQSSILCLATLSDKKIFPTSNLNFPWEALDAFPSHPILTHKGEENNPTSPQPPLRWL